LTADLLFDASKVSAEEAVEQITKLRPEGYQGWPGADATILTADPESAQRFGLDITRRHGLFIAVSQPPSFAFTFRDFVFRDITVVGTMHGTVDDLRACIDMAGKYGIRSDVSTFKMDEHEAMLDSVHYAGRKGKSVMVF